MNNVFKGENSILDFLNPEKNIPTPLVEIPKHLNPFHDDGIRIFAKLMNFTPLRNVKSYPAFNMIMEANKKGLLKGVDTLVENSSGNTIYSVRLISKSLGIKNTKAFVSSQVSLGKLDLLKFFNVDIEVNNEPICPNPNDPNSGINKARKLGKEKGFFNPGQYSNEDNYLSHYKWTGKQIYEQLENKVDIFCAGLGTTGTFIGTIKYLKEKNNKTISVGVIRKPNNPVPGVRTLNLLSHISFDWKNYLDNSEYIDTKDSYLYSLNLSREGLICGPSSGFAFAGLLNFLKKQKKKDNFKTLLNGKKTINCVFICPDDPYPYIDEYFKYLDKKYFPKIVNEELLNPEKQTPEKIDIKGFEIKPKDLYKRILNKENIKIIDVRDEYSFSDHHIEGSINIDYNKIVLEDKNLIEDLKKEKTVVIVCKIGAKSSFSVNVLRKHNINAFSLEGGTMAWSDLDLPRVQDESCLMFKSIV